MGISAQHISKRFGDFVALDDVGLDVDTGQLTALLGPSGGGKSTLLRIIGGLEDPDSGTVAFGLEIRKRPSAEIRRRVHELLDLVHLGQFADRLPSQLSGGQRQRMALARALAVEPKVLLLDEPFGALDAKVRKELRDWLRRLHDEVHVTTVFVTHDQEEALEVADEIVVINNGRVEQTGSPNDLYDHPANDFVMGFLGPVTRLGGHLVRPHDIEVLTAESAGAARAEVVRLVRIGFEVRAELRSDSEAGNTAVQLTRGQADALDLRAGSTVWLRPAHDASVLAAP